MKNLRKYIKKSRDKFTRTLSTEEFIALPIKEKYEYLKCCDTLITEEEQNTDNFIPTKIDCSCRDYINEHGGVELCDAFKEMKK